MASSKLYKRVISYAASAGTGHDCQLSCDCSAARVSAVALGPAYGKQSFGDSVFPPWVYHAIGEELSSKGWLLRLIRTSIAEETTEQCHKFARLSYSQALSLVRDHLGCAAQFSVVQLPLSVMALGVYLRVSSCTPWAKPHQATPAQPFCSAPIVLAAIIVLVEVRATPCASPKAT